MHTLLQALKDKHPGCVVADIRLDVPVEAQSDMDIALAEAIRSAKPITMEQL